MFKFMFETPFGRAIVCGLAVALPPGLVLVFFLRQLWISAALFAAGIICWFFLGGEASIRRHMARLRAQPPRHLRNQRVARRHRQ